MFARLSRIHMTLVGLRAVLRRLWPFSSQALRRKTKSLQGLTRVAVFPLVKNGENGRKRRKTASPRGVVRRAEVGERAQHESRREQCEHQAIGQVARAVALDDVAGEGGQ